MVSLIARGAPRDEIALGVHHAIVGRTASLAGGITVEPPVLFTGGCAHNACLVELLGEALRHPVEVPDSPQTLAALGCALHAGQEGARA